MMRIVRRAAAVLNGAAVVVLLAAFAAVLWLLIAGWLQGTKQPALFGYAVCIVQDDSASPALQKGDLALVRARDAYEPGELVCYQQDSLAFGRVLQRSSLSYTLGGDGRKTAKATGVGPEQIVGAVALRVPRLGGWLAAGSTLRGLAVLLCAGVLLAELPAFLRPVPRPARRRAAGS